MSRVQLTEEAETIVEEIICNSGEKHLRDCLPDVLDTRGRREVAGLTCSMFTNVSVSLFYIIV